MYNIYLQVYSNVERKKEFLRWITQVNDSKKRREEKKNYRSPLKKDLPKIAIT